MAENQDLSPSQTEKLLQFQDLTRIEDLNRCRQIMGQYNWDLETAVQDTLNIQEGGPSIYRPSPPAPPPVVLDHAEQRVFNAVQNWRPRGVFGWGKFILYLPFTIVYNSIMGIIKFAWQLIRPDPRRIVTDPLADVLKFIEDYEQKYGRNHPVFYQGTYSQALNDAKRELKFLLVYLHGDDHQDTVPFCRKTLANQNVVRFINTQMLFWACSINLPEGYRVSQALRENGYPFLAIIVLRENRMTVVARLEGFMESEVVINRLQQVMADNEGALISAQMEREERSLNQTLRQQQDEAYLVSLKADQEKEKRRKEERERMEMEMKAKMEKEEVERKRKEEISLMKVELRDQIPEEPADHDPSCIKVVIKLPSGLRLERRFKRSQSLKYLYFYVFCHEASPDHFEIITNFPRRSLPCEPTRECPDPPTFAEVGLGKTETLFVHDLDA